MFLIFAFNAFYPLGGVNDLKGTAKTFDEAREQVAAIETPYDFIEVVDASTMEVVWRKHA